MNSSFPSLAAPSHQSFQASSFDCIEPPPLPRVLKFGRTGTSEVKATWQQADHTVAIVGVQLQTWELAQQLIDDAKGLSFSTAFADIESALRGLRHHRPEVLLMDFSLLRLQGAGCIPALRQHSARMKILILTNGEDCEEILAALRAGANGFVLKRNLTVDLLPAIRQVVAGETPMSSDVTARVAAFFRQQGESFSEIDDLPPRLKQVLDHLAKGCLYKEIADRLGITYDTVNGYVKVIYERLRVHSRGEAVAKYMGR